MKKSLIVCVLLLAFTCSTVCYGIDSVRTLVYRGTINASNSLFDVNNPVRLYSAAVKGYWAITVYDLGHDKGSVVDSNAVIYDPKHKYYKVMPGEITSDPCDPCGAVMFVFETGDADGYMEFFTVGAGKLIKYSNDSSVEKDFVPVALKGSGLLHNFDFFDPDYTYSGSVTVTLTLDLIRTRTANPDIYFPDDIINDLVAQLTKKGGWTQWPYHLNIL